MDSSTSSSSGAPASDDAKARAARMAAFSSQVNQEEEQEVAVRSFTEARDGAEAGRAYDPRTGAVASKPGPAAPPPVRPASTVSDDDLLAEIDAAVAAAEADAPVPQADASEEPPEDAEGGLENLEAFPTDASPDPGAPQEEPDMPDAPFSVRVDRPAGAGKVRVRSDDVEVKHDGGEAHAVGKPKNPAEGQFGVRMDKPKAAPAPKIRSPADSDYKVAMDKTSSELADSATKAALEDVFGSPKPTVKHDAPPRPPKPAAAQDLAPPAAAVRHDAERRSFPRLQSPGDAAVEARVDRQPHRAAPKLRAPSEEPMAVRRDAEPKPLPRMRSAADADAYAVRRDAEAKPLPKMRSAADAEPMAVRQDAESKPLPRMRSAADADAYAVRRDAEAKPLPKMRSAADADAYAVRRDAEAKPLPKMRSAAEGEFGVRMDKPVGGTAPRVRAAEGTVDVNRPPTFQPPRIHAAEREFGVRMDKPAAGAAPRIRSPADAEDVAVNRPPTFQPPRVLGSASAEVDVHRPPTFQPPRIRGSDAENVDLHKPATFRPPQIRAAPDVDPSSVRKDREERARASVSNPGQSEFEVKYEHESVWTTAPRRDVDQTPTTKKKA